MTYLCLQCSVTITTYNIKSLQARLHLYLTYSWLTSLLSTPLYNIHQREDQVCKSTVCNLYICREYVHKQLKSISREIDQFPGEAHYCSLVAQPPPPEGDIIGYIKY